MLWDSRVGTPCKISEGILGKTRGRLSTDTLDLLQGILRAKLGEKSLEEFWQTSSKNLCQKSWGSSSEIHDCIPKNPRMGIPKFYFFFHRNPTEFLPGFCSVLLPESVVGFFGVPPVSYKKNCVISLTVPWICLQSFYRNYFWDLNLDFLGSS